MMSQVVELVSQVVELVWPGWHVEVDEVVEDVFVGLARVA